MAAPDGKVYIRCPRLAAKVHRALKVVAAESHLTLQDAASQLIATHPMILSRIEK